VLTETAKLVSLTEFEQQERGSESIVMTAKATEIVYLGGGRPLGGKLVSNDDGRTHTLYAADAVFGLIRVRNVPRVGTKEDAKRTQQPIVEIVANRVKTEDGTWSKILYADDVDIGPKTGCVYFTDGTCNCVFVNGFIGVSCCKAYAI